ncbi:sensor histidine kinase [Massilia sp.]|uniref:sensor histidine kinase n=1 Tax=Massilia sp. TaxID=1882437 RepID=UPI00352DECAA
MAELWRRNRSLRGMLLVWVLVPQLLVWIAGGFATYRLTVGYLNEAADAVLLQATRALSRQVKPIGSGLVIDFPQAAQAMLEADPTDRLLYTVSTPPGKLILGNYLLPLPPAHLHPRVGEPYFYDGEVVGGAGGAMRRVRISALFLKNDDAGGHQQWMLVQVARSMASRDSLVKRVLVDTLLPLSSLIVLITVLMWVGIRAGLAPLNRLRSEVEGRSPLNLTPLQIDVAPQEVRSLVGALNELLTSVRQNVSAQQRFIADAAHQLRTPIAGLQSQTEIALRVTTDAALLPRLHRVHRSAIRASHLISQLLMLARAEPEASQAHDLVPTDLTALVRTVVADIVPVAARRGLDLGMEDACPDEDARITVLANPRLLQEAISNVLDNAIEYAGAGCEVTVQVSRADDVARLVISDNGPGIPSDFRGNLFDRFVRATHQGTGCGLGLSIVREIILRHQGSVTLQPLQPHGLAVVMNLPVAMDTL